MKKRQRIRKFFLFVVTLILCHLSIPTYAADDSTDSKTDTSSEDSSVGYTVSPVPSSNQIDEGKGFFYLRTKPEQEQTIKVIVKSTQEQASTVEIYVRDGYTSDAGEIAYGGEKEDRDETLIHSIEDMTTVNTKEVTVKNFEEKEVTLTLNPPKEEIDGIRVGAIYFMNKSEKKESGLSSQYGYRLGLVVSETDEAYDTSASLNLKRVKAGVVRGKRVIEARLQNPESKILKDLTVETKLRKKGEDQVLRSEKKTEMRMAPNSHFDFATNWGVDPITAGTYILSIKATSGENTWEWKETIVIGEKEAKQMNDEAVVKLTTPKWVPIVAVAISVLIMGILARLYIRGKKWRDLVEKDRKE